MGIVVTEDIYDLILSEYGEDFVFYDEEENEYWVYASDLIDAGYANEIDGGVYLISLNPSQKGVFIGNL
ncbi:MAG: hypothetical protein IKF90_02525 [Parasporobacterium sp.]|nr:hypothetical protein [Parasporobacterium sp.]